MEEVKDDRIRIIIYVFVVVAIGLIATLFVKAVIKTGEEAPMKAKYAEFLQYCNRFGATEYLVVRNDTKEVYLKCSK